MENNDSHEGRDVGDCVSLHACEGGNEREGFTEKRSISVQKYAKREIERRIEIVQAFWRLPETHKNVK